MERFSKQYRHFEIQNYSQSPLFIICVFLFY